MRRYSEADKPVFREKMEVEFAAALEAIPEPHRAVLVGSLGNASARDAMWGRITGL